MGAKSLPRALSTLRENAQRGDLEPIFEYLSPIEDLSELKPLLSTLEWRAVDRSTIQF